MITLRLGVEGSLTPWAQALAGTANANMIKTNRFMRYLPIKNAREAGTVPSRLLDRSLRDLTWARQPACHPSKRLGRPFRQEGSPSRSGLRSAGTQLGWSALFSSGS